MNTATTGRQVGGITLIGILLLVAGVLSLGARVLDIDPFAATAAGGWPLLVIMPGLVLLAASVFPAPPSGLGFAIPGSIVTTVGLVLFYQQSTGHWESWAYSWALVGPGGAGLGMLLYGLLFRQREIVSNGARLTAIAAVLFGVGLWYFETIFRTGQVPIDLGGWWPLVLIVFGVIALVAGLRDGSPRDVDPETTSGTVR